MDSQTLEEPLDLLRLSLGQTLFIKMRNNIELKGTLISYDLHLNMLLAKVEETQQQQKRKMDALYLRGDGIILISPLSKGITDV